MFLKEKKGRFEVYTTEHGILNNFCCSLNLKKQNTCKGWLLILPNKYKVIRLGQKKRTSSVSQIQHLQYAAQLKTRRTRMSWMSS